MTPRRVLIVSPHFPPDSSAATHRVRLLAPRLPAYGWEPTVLTVEPDAYEGRLDRELAAALPPGLRVVRTPAWPAGWTRAVGFGDLGLRAFSGLRRTAASLLAREAYDALFITLYPVYPALLGPILKRRFGVPYVLDYQDPWVGSWGLTVGGSPDGGPDLRSRVSRWVGCRLEPIAVRAAGGLMAVSAGTLDTIRARIPEALDTPSAEVPIGFDRRDFEPVNGRPVSAWIGPGDDRVHIAYVGTLLPNGFDTLRALFGAVRRLRDGAPRLFERVRLHFIGTSNQTGDGRARALPIARELGIETVVAETPGRLDYFDALAVLRASTAVALLGSTEPHYTASKIYPALLARRPVLAVFHEQSPVVPILRRVSSPPSVRVVTYGADGPAAAVDDILGALRSLVEHPVYSPGAVSDAVLDDWSAPVLAGRVAKLLDDACRSRR